MFECDWGMWKFEIKNHVAGAIGYNAYFEELPTPMELATTIRDTATSIRDVASNILDKAVSLTVEAQAKEFEDYAYALEAATWPATLEDYHHCDLDLYLSRINYNGGSQMYVVGHLTITELGVWKRKGGNNPHASV